MAEQIIGIESVKANKEFVSSHKYSLHELESFLKKNHPYIDIVKAEYVIAKFNGENEVTNIRKGDRFSFSEKGPNIVITRIRDGEKLKETMTIGPMNILINPMFPGVTIYKGYNDNRFLLRVGNKTFDNLAVYSNKMNIHALKAAFDKVLRRILIKCGIYEQLTNCKVNTYRFSGIQIDNGEGLNSKVRFDAASSLLKIMGYGIGTGEYDNYNSGQRGEFYDGDNRKLAAALQFIIDDYSTKNKK